MAFALNLRISRQIGLKNRVPKESKNPVCHYDPKLLMIFFSLEILLETLCLHSYLCLRHLDKCVYKLGMVIIHTAFKHKLEMD